MKSLVIYYSLEGNTKLIADTIKNELNSDVLELRTKKQYPNKGFKKYLCGGKSVILKEKPKLLNKYIDISIYDKIFIGTPIWAGTYAVPFNTFFNEYKIKNKEIGLFVCHAGGRSNKCFDNLKKQLKGNKIIGEIEYIEPLKNNKEENINKTINCIKNL